MGKVFIHDSVENPSAQRGVNRGFLNYLNALISEFSEEVILYSDRFQNQHEAKTICPVSAALVKYNVNLRKYGKVDCFWGEMIANHCARVFYSPYYGRLQTKIPQVYTAWDMIYEKFPQYFPLTKQDVSLHIKEKRTCFERAELIICISNSTRNDILEIYPHIPSAKLKTVYLGVDEIFFEDMQGSARRNDQGKPYLLFVGNRDLYKNFTRFLGAFGRSGVSSDFELRIISPTAVKFTNIEVELIQRYNLADCIKIERGLVSDDYRIIDSLLRPLYHNAYALVYPSEYEGFGFPIIEALASGTLVITSNISSIPEIGGAAPLYFSPESEESIIETLRSAQKMSAEERRERISQGKNHSRQFTWKASCDKFMEEINSII